MFDFFQRLLREWCLEDEAESLQVRLHVLWVSKRKAAWQYLNGCNCFFQWNAQWVSYFHVLCCVCTLHWGDKKCRTTGPARVLRKLQSKWTQQSYALHCQFWKYTSLTRKISKYHNLSWNLLSKVLVKGYTRVEHKHSLSVVCVALLDRHLPTI